MQRVGTPTYCFAKLVLLKHLNSWYTQVLVGAHILLCPISGTTVPENVDLVGTN